VCQCGHAGIDHRKEKDHDECQIRECGCDTLRPIAQQPPATDDRVKEQGSHAVGQEWTPDSVRLLFEQAGRKCYEGWKAISDAHNAAVAAERELGKALLETERKQREIRERIGNEHYQQLLAAQAAIAEHNKQVDKWNACSSSPDNRAFLAPTSKITVKPKQKEIQQPPVTDDKPRYSDSPWVGKSERRFLEQGSQRAKVKP